MHKNLDKNTANKLGCGLTTSEEMEFSMVVSKKRSTILLIAVVSVGLMFVGCFRGKPTDNTPIHLNPNMDMQPKYKALGSSEFFENGSAMRVPVTGTVSRGFLREDVDYYTGNDASGKLIAVNPEEMTKELLNRGQERYNIYCAPCHSKTGDGKGIVTKYEFIPMPTSMHEKRLLEIEDGHLYDVITNGIRNMKSYKSQINVKDRWAITAYVRALQRSQNASADDVPENKR